MSTQASANSRNRYRYHIDRIELRSTQKVNGKIWAQLQVDGGIVHTLSSIKKGQPLAWDGPFHCDAKPDSLIGFQIHELEASLLRHKHTLRCNIEFSMSVISNELPVCSIERSSNALSVSFTFLNPPSVLNPSTIRASFETILNFGTAVSKLCPAVAQTALSSCQTACERLRNETEYSKDIEEVAVGFADILRPIHSVNQDTDSRDLRDTAAGILDIIQKASVFVTSYISMTSTARRASTFVLSCRRRVQEFLEQLGQLKHDFDRQVDDDAAYLARIDEAVARLKPVAHSTHRGNRECLPDTRTTLIGDIIEWVERETGPERLLRIHGPSGIGKSAVAASVCCLLEARNLLCASFFCRWDDPELREAKPVIRSVVYGLAKHHAGCRNLIASAVADDLKLSDLSFRLLYERLVTMPLIAANNQATKWESTCIVIDALDQCGDSQTRRGLLSYLFTLSQQVSWLKIIVTACSTHDIQDSFGSISEDSLRRMDVCEYDASNDILTFIRKQMSSGDGSASHLDDSHAPSLADCAGCLYICADIACRFILDGPDPHRRLADILRNSAIANPSLQLELLYATVLEEIIMLSINEEHASKRWLKAIAATALRAPLSIDSLEQLLGEYLCHEVSATAPNIFRVLYEVHPNDGHSVIRAYHRSFINYIIAQSCSNDFYVDKTSQNIIFSTRCLSTMLNELKFNICRLETSYMRNSDVTDLESRVSSAISPHLRYSCLWWIDHVILADRAYVDLALLKEFFLSQTLFYWIEALSLMNQLDAAVSQLPMLLVWAQESPDLIELAECVRDAHKFITSFYDVILKSSPHLYLSALAFAPIHSATAQRGRQWFSSIPKLTEGAQQSWPRCLRILPLSSLALCLSPSPDGHTIVTGSNDHIVRLWDLTTNLRVIARLIGHSDCVWSVAFSPNGRYIASGSHDKTVRVWDAKTGCKVLEPLKGHTGPVLSVGFSHDGQHIVSGSHDKTVRVWDSETGVETIGPLIGHTGPVLSVVFSPTEHCIASGSFDRTIRIWDLGTGVSTLLLGHTGWVRSVAFSPDGRYIASGSYDKTIRIWDPVADEKTYISIPGHSSEVYSVAFSPDGLHIISGSRDKTVRMWDVGTGAELFATFADHSDGVISVGLFSDGGGIISGSRKDKIWIWDSSKATEAEIHIPSVEILGPRLSDSVSPPEGHHIASGSADKTMQIWKGEPSSEVSISLVGHSGAVWSVAFSPDGQLIVSGSGDNTLQIWDAKTGAETSPPAIGHSGSVNSVTFSPDSRRIFSGSESSDNTVCIWDAGTGTQLFSPLVVHSDSVLSVAFSPDGRRIVSGSFDHTMRMWDAKTGSQLSAPRTSHSSYVWSVAFSPDSRRIASGSGDKTVLIWDAETGAKMSAPLVGHSGEVNSVAFSPDGRRIASGSDDRTVRIWGADTGAEVSAPLVGHSGGVLSVAFSPDGQFIASGSTDKTVLMWDTETSKQVSPPLVGHSGPVTSVAFSPDGRRIVSGSTDKTVRIWDVVHHLVTARYHFPLSYLIPFIESTGWVSFPGKPCLLWIPSELRTSIIDAGSTPNSGHSIPPSSRVVIDLSRFVHGRQWAAVATD